MMERMLEKDETRGNWFAGWYEVAPEEERVEKVEVSRFDSVIMY